MASLERALQELYRSPLARFLEERKRLAAELRSAGDASGAADLARRRKPTASVWAVNQLYWQARAAFDDMTAAAAKLRRGDVSATRAYRDATNRLHARAREILRDAGLGASDATLRRVTTTLAAIGASGGFEPDPPGALTEDRDPPGFGAIGIAPEATGDDAPHEATSVVAGTGAKAKKSARDRGEKRRDERARAADEAANRRAEAARQRAEEAAERKRRQEERARRKAESDRLQKALRAAQAEVERQEQKLAALEEQTRAAQKALREAKESAADLAHQRAMLDDATD
jgi:hypothetical protein